MENTNRFISDLNELTSAGVGVIIVRTREGFRTKEAIELLAKQKERPFFSWDCLVGWSHAPAGDATSDGEKDPIKALGKIPTDFPSHCIATMLYPQWVLGKSPHFTQMLRNYAYEFSQGLQRLILVVPSEFTIPSELEDEITVMDFLVPSGGELEQSFKDIESSSCESRGVDGLGYTDEQIQEILSAAQGITRQEFENAVSRTIVANRDVFPNIPFKDFLRGVMEAKTDVVKRSQVLEIMPSEDISSIGGLDNLKEWILERAQCYSEEARAFGIEPPKGCALLGPAGTGKSLSMKVIANTLGVPLIRFDVGRVFGKYVGESEGRVRSALQMLEGMAPCVAFIDEVDKAGLNANSGGDSGVGNRILGSILTFMQETKAPIFWGFTANRVRGVDSALLRKGRLDEIFCVSVPNAEERMEIFKIHLKKRGRSPEKIKDLNVAVEASENYVSAELESAVKDALVKAFISGGIVSGELIAEQLRSMKPLSEAFAEDFAEMHEWASKNAKPASREVSEVVSKKEIDVKPRRRRRIATN